MESLYIQLVVCCNLHCSLRQVDTLRGARIIVVLRYCKLTTPLTV